MYILILGIVLAVLNSYLLVVWLDRLAKMDTKGAVIAASVYVLISLAGLIASLVVVVCGIDKL